MCAIKLNKLGNFWTKKLRMSYQQKNVILEESLHNPQIIFFFFSYND